MAGPANNPLFKHFRQPAIYLRLPSMGQFWPDHAIDLGATGEIPVYPMTIKDEITLKTPDGLLNGSSVVNVIESCCPQIKDAWAVPAVDLDPILIAIRIASYGPTMEITAKCPHCGEESSYDVDLRVLLDSLPPVEFPPTTIDHLTFNLKSRSFKSLNQVNLINYEQQRLLAAISDSDLSDEEKTAKFQEIFPKLTDLNISTLVDSIQSINDGTTVVDNYEFIKEFITNCDRAVYAQVKDTIEKLSAGYALKPMPIQCNSCNEWYESTLNFEQSNFFA